MSSTPSDRTLQVAQVSQNATDTRKTVLITGCTPGGIGAALAQQFQAAGLRVFATARRPSKLASFPDQGIETLELDVTKETSIQNCFDHVSKLTQGRGLDYLINNAGMNYTVPALDIEIDQLRDTVFATNVFGVMRMCSVFAPLLLRAQGTIVMLGSVAAITPYAFGSGYNASKAALHAYANTLRVELAPFGIDVVTIITGGVLSNIASHFTRKLKPNSWYTSIDDAYQARQKHSQSVGIDTHQYAQSVVNQILPARTLFVGLYRAWIAGSPPKNSRKRWLWVGAKTGLVWFLSAGWWLFLVSNYADHYMSKRFGLYRLGAARERILKDLDDDISLKALSREDGSKSLAVDGVKSELSEI